MPQRQNLVDYFFEGLAARDRIARERQQTVMDMLGHERAQSAIDLQRQQLEETKRENLARGARSEAEAAETRRRNDLIEEAKRRDDLLKVVELTRKGEFTAQPSTEAAALEAGALGPLGGVDIAGQRVIPVPMEKQAETAANLKSKIDTIGMLNDIKTRQEILDTVPALSKGMTNRERKAFLAGPGAKNVFESEATGNKVVQLAEELHPGDPRGQLGEIMNYVNARDRYLRMTPWQNEQLKGRDAAGQLIREAAQEVLKKYNLTSPAQVTAKHREEIENLAMAKATQAGVDPRLIAPALREIGAVSPGQGRGRMRLEDILGGATPTPTPGPNPQIPIPPPQQPTRSSTGGWIYDVLNKNR